MLSSVLDPVNVLTGESRIECDVRYHGWGSQSFVVYLIFIYFFRMTSTCVHLFRCPNKMHT